MVDFSIAMLDYRSVTEKVLTTRSQFANFCWFD